MPYEINTDTKSVVVSIEVEDVDLSWSRVLDIPSWLGLYFSKNTAQEVTRVRGKSTDFDVGTAFLVGGRELEVLNVDISGKEMKLQTSVKVNEFERTVTITVKVKGNTLEFTRDQWKSNELLGWPVMPSNKTTCDLICPLCLFPFCFLFFFSGCLVFDQSFRNAEAKKNFERMILKLKRYFNAPRKEDVLFVEAEVV